MNINYLQASAERFVESALMGTGWVGAINALAEATRGTGSVLMSYRGQNLEAALPSTGLEELYRRFQAGEAPFCSRLTRINLSLGEGFRVDHDDYTDAELEEDPWYQEFLKPQGAFWNAVAKLSGGWDGYGIELSFKREFQAGPYRPEERTTLNTILPDLRAAARIAGNALDVISDAIGRQLQHRGNPVFELDACGKVRRTHGTENGSELPIQMVGQQLVAVDRSVQADLDRVVARSVRHPRRTAVMALPVHNRTRYLLQCVPVVGEARDVFHATLAVAVLIPASPRLNACSIDPVLLREAFSLTHREAQLAGFLADGLDLNGIALRLDIDLGTARNHLKSIFSKTGAHRQGELVALLSRLRP